MEINFNLPRSLLGFFVVLAKRFKFSFFASVLGIFAVLIEQTSFPYATKLIVDKLTSFNFESNVFKYLTPELIFLFSIWIGNDLIWRISGYANAYFGSSIGSYIKEMFVLKSLEQKPYFFKKHPSGDILSRIISLSENIEYVFWNYTYFIVPCFLNALLAILMIWKIVHWKIALSLLFWILIHTTIVMFRQKKYLELSEINGSESTKFNEMIQDSIGNNYAVRTFNGIKNEMRFLSHFSKKQFNAQKNMWYSLHTMMLILVIVCFLINGLVSVYLEIDLFQQKKITVGDIAMIFGLMINLTKLIFDTTLAFGWTSQKYGALKEQYKIVLNMENKPCEKKKKPKTENFLVKNGEIEFRNVTFDYIKSEEDKIFMNYNMKIKAGESVGIIGSSGAGKSTVINLIMRDYDLDSGHIFIDGIDISNLNQSDVMQNIAYIPQNPTLFNRSIKDNIKYGKQNATDWEILEAARIAGLHEDILEMQDQYETLCGELGSSLSGGQRQRVAIARAVLKNSKILIMDEATSALDVETERDIRNALEKIIKGKTTIIIAHRLSTVANLDRIMVFEDGDIVEDGNPEKLLENENGYYRKMVDMHIEEFEDE